MSGEKCGEISVTAEEVARRERQRLQRLAAEASARERERRERGWADLAAEYDRIDRALEELTILGSPDQSEHARRVSRDAAVDPSPLLEYAAVKYAELRALLSRRRRDLECAVLAVNAEIAAVTAQFERLRAAQVAAGVPLLTSIGIPPALPLQIDGRTTASTKSTRGAVRSSISLLDSALVRLAESKSEIAIAPLRQALKGASAAAVSSDDRASEEPSTAVPHDLVVQTLLFDDWSVTRLATRLLDTAAGEGSGEHAGIAIQSARELIGSLVRLSERQRAAQFRVSDAVAMASASVHEDDLQLVAAVFSQLAERVAMVKRSRTVEDAGGSLEELEATLDGDLTLLGRESASVRVRAEADRQAAAFVRALRVAGFEPLVEPATTVRIPRGGQLGPIGSSDADERHIVRRFAHQKDPSRQVVLLQSLDEPGRMTTITGAGAPGVSLPSLVRGITSSPGPDPDWVAAVCAKALPDAEAILQENGYSFTYAPWAPRVTQKSQGVSASEVDDDAQRTSREAESR